MPNKDQDQSVTEGSTAIQAGGDVTITQTGLTYAEARKVALDVFKANFYELAGVAQETARRRAEEITEKFLEKLLKENPAGLEQSNDPDFQYALFTVQKEHAKNGDKELGDILVDLLVDRSKHKQRDFRRIVLNESLKTAPLLTDNQLAALAIVFILRYTVNYKVVDHETLGEYLDKYVAPFSSKTVKNMACYQHLEFAGCGAISVGEAKLENILLDKYPGLFLKGFEEKAIADKAVSIGADPRMFCECLNDPSKLQVRAINDEALDRSFEEHNVPDEDRDKIRALFGEGKMSHPEVKDTCVGIRPFLSELFDTWSESDMKHLTLTSVGIAIGHANAKRFLGEFTDLSVWIN